MFSSQWQLRLYTAWYLNSPSNVNSRVTHIYTVFVLLWYWASRGRHRSRFAQCYRFCCWWCSSSQFAFVLGGRFKRERKVKGGCGGEWPIPQLDHRQYHRLHLFGLAFVCKMQRAVLSQKLGTIQSQRIIGSSTCQHCLFRFIMLGGLSRLIFFHSRECLMSIHTGSIKIYQKDKVAHNQFYVQK